MASSCDLESHGNKLVSRIDFSSANLDAAWAKFKSQFKVYALAKGYGKLSEEEQIANMLVCMAQKV